MEMSFGGIREANTGLLEVASRPRSLPFLLKFLGWVWPVLEPIVSADEETWSWGYIERSLSTSYVAIKANYVTTIIFN